MSDSRATGSSRNSRFIKAPREDVYRAFLDPEALSAWLAPDTMTGTVHEMDARVGGGYVMSLFYPSTEAGSPGKTADLEDRFRARFVELSPPERIVEVVTFDSDDPAFSGEMTMVVTLRAVNGGTDVVMEFSDIPPGIRPEDNEAGTRMSLEKLARCLEPVNPDQPSPESRLRDSWRDNAGAWTDAVREGRIESRRLGTDDALLETITARAPGSARARVLDVGCGEGWLARALEPRGFDVVGIDGSEALIRAAQRLGGGSFQVVGYDELVDDPGVVAGPFDAVVCNFSLLSEHVAPVLRALADRLVPDSRTSPPGALIIQTVHPFTAAGEEPYRDGWREETFSGFGDDFAAPMPWYYRTVGSWIRELRAAGLAVVECREPLDPRTGRPLSLIMAARRTPAARHSRGPAGRG